MEVIQGGQSSEAKNGEAKVDNFFEKKRELAKRILLEASGQVNNNLVRLKILETLGGKPISIHTIRKLRDELGIGQVGRGRHIKRKLKNPPSVEKSTLTRDMKLYGPVASYMMKHDVKGLHFYLVDHRLHVTKQTINTKEESVQLNVR